MPVGVSAFLIEAEIDCYICVCVCVCVCLSQVERERECACEKMFVRFVSFSSSGLFRPRGNGAKIFRFFDLSTDDSNAKKRVSLEI